MIQESFDAIRYLCKTWPARYLHRKRFHLAESRLLWSPWLRCDTCLSKSLLSQHGSLCFFHPVSAASVSADGKTKVRPQAKASCLPSAEWEPDGSGKGSGGKTLLGPKYQKSGLSSFMLLDFFFLRHRDIVEVSVSLPFHCKCENASGWRGLTY